MSRTQRLVVVLVLNLGLVAGLVVVGVTAHSIAVLAEGGDYLLDAAGIAVALAAIWLAARPATRARPGGYPNATSIAALINAGWLLILELLVAAVALNRLLTHRVPVDGLPVLVMSGVAAVAMLVGAIILVTGGWYWLDPAVALAIAVVVAYHAVALIRKVLARRRLARSR